VDAPEPITRQRLVANRRSRARRDGADDFVAILTVWELPTTDEDPLILRFGDDAGGWTIRNAEALSSKSQ
jgi:hypothetical protein